MFQRPSAFRSMLMTLRRIDILRYTLIALILRFLVPAPPLAGQDTWYSAYDKALECISASRWEEAIGHLEKAVSLKPEPELNARTYGVWRRNYLPYFYLGQSHFNLGHYEVAKAYFERSLAAGAVKNSPETLQMLNDYLKAIEEKTSAARSGQELQERIATEMEKGLELENEGNLREALVRFESVLTLDPEHKQAAEHVQLIKQELERQEQSASQKKTVEEALALGQKYLEADSVKEALACLDQALKIEPQNPQAILLREKVVVRRTELEKEASLKRERIKKLLEKGVELFGLESWEEARKSFTEILDLDPENSEAWEYINRIARKIEEIQRLREQENLLAEASRLIEHDSLISARDKLLQNRQLGPSSKADSILAILERRLTESEGQRINRLLPRIVLKNPADSAITLNKSRIIISGTAFDEEGIRRIYLTFNGEQRDILFFSGDSQLPVRHAFEETLSLAKGVNLLEIVAVDKERRSSSVLRRIYYQPVLWRNPLFIAFWTLVLVIAGGSLFYYKRNVLHMYFNRFRRRTFEVITPNPFIVGNPIRSREMFFGREDDFRFVKNKVDTEKYGSLIVLFGERRAGKTSVLYQILGGRLGQNYRPVFFDMQAMAINDDWEFLGRMAEITLDTVKKDNLNFKMAAFEDRSKNPYTLFDKFVDRILQAIVPEKLLFLIDEYELIEDKVEDGKIKKDIFLFLSGLVEHKAGLFLVFAGTNRLQDREKPYWQPLLQRCDYRNISYLTTNDTYRLIQEPVRGKVFYLGSAVRSITSLTAGQPFYTQLICRNIVEMLNTEKRNYFYEDDISTVVREIIDNPPPQMFFFWAGLSPEEKGTLSVIAELAKSENHYPNVDEMGAALRKSNLNISPEAVKTACERLLSREILEQNAKNAYRFRMDLFRLWIREEHNLYRVSREIEQNSTA